MAIVPECATESSQIQVADELTRRQIEILAIQLGDAEAAEKAARGTGASFSSQRKAYKAFAKAKSNIERARRDAISQFARPRGWRLEGGRGLVLGHGMGVSELHNESLADTWCETCGGLCTSARDNTHRGGERDALCLRRGYQGRTEAVIQHTEHPFRACQLLAYIFGLHVVQLDWSWYGRQTAALFTRSDRS